MSATRPDRSRVVIALDLDGTLEDSRDDMAASVVRVRTGLGLPPGEAADYRPHVNRGMPHLYATAFAELREQPEAFAQAQRAYTDDYGAHIADQTRLYDGIASALAELAALGRLALVTNKPQGLSDQLLRALGVREPFEAVIGGDTCAEGKPSPLPLRTAARTLGVDPDEAVAQDPKRLVMIGDSAGDVRCGRAAQAFVIGCAWGYRPLPPELSPDALANHPEQLARIVADHLSR